MEHLKTAVLAMILLVSPLFSAATPSENEPEAASFGAEADFNTRYIWHGQRYSGGSVLQPSAWVSARGLTATFWSNIEIARDLNEVNAIFEYPFEINKISIDPSVSYYNYFNQPDGGSTIEAAFKISRPLSSEFSLYTSHNFYFLNEDYGDSYFGGLGVDYGTDLTEKLKLSVSPFAAAGSVKYNRENFGYAGWAFDLVSADVSLEYAIAAGWYLKPHFTYSFITDNKLMEKDRGNVSSGIALGAEF